MGHEGGGKKRWVMKGGEAKGGGSWGGGQKEVGHERVVGGG